MYRRGIINLLRHLGILPGAPEVDAPPREIIGRADADVIAPVGGVFRPLVEPGTVVTVGTPIARITDFRGALLHELTSPRDGVVLSMRSRSAVEPGDSIALVFILA